MPAPQPARYVIPRDATDSVPNLDTWTFTVENVITLVWALKSHALTHLYRAQTPNNPHWGDEIVLARNAIDLAGQINVTLPADLIVSELSTIRAAIESAATQGARHASH